MAHQTGRLTRVGVSFVGFCVLAACDPQERATVKEVTVKHLEAPYEVVVPRGSLKDHQKVRAARSKDQEIELYLLTEARDPAKFEIIVPRGFVSHFSQASSQILNSIFASRREGAFGTLALLGTSFEEDKRVAICETTHCDLLLDLTRPSSPKAIVTIRSFYLTSFLDLQLMWAMDSPARASDLVKGAEVLLTGWRKSEIGAPIREAIVAFGLDTSDVLINLVLDRSYQDTSYSEPGLAGVALQQVALMRETFSLEKKEAILNLVATSTENGRTELGTVIISLE